MLDTVRKEKAQLQAAYTLSANTYRRSAYRRDDLADALETEAKMLKAEEDLNPWSADLTASAQVQVKTLTKDIHPPSSFTTAHKSGALVEVLDVFREFGLNLTNIDTRPSKKKQLRVLLLNRLGGPRRR